MSQLDKTKAEEEELIPIEPDLGSQPAQRLAEVVDWAKDKIPQELAQASTQEPNFDSFVEVDKKEKKQEDAKTPGDKDAANKALLPPFASQLPPGVLEAPQKAFELLKAIKPGQPLDNSQRQAMAAALADARKLTPQKAAELEKQLIEDVQSKQRKLPDGTILPPWTIEKEKQFSEKLELAQRAFVSMSPESQAKVSETEGHLSKLAADDIRRDVFKRLLRSQADSDPALKQYLDRAEELDSFTKENAAGLMRRAMHQQEMMVLHAPAICSGIAAIALDKTAQKADEKQIGELLKSALADRFALANIAELPLLAEKYKIELSQDAQFDSRVAGRADLRRALEIMKDPAAGTAVERLEKAKEFFQKAIGASDQTSLKDTLAELEEIATERNKLGESISPEKMNELENRAVELLEKIKIPYEARVQYASALNDAAVETKNPEFSKQALALLEAAERLDPANEFDPFLQGAKALVQKVPPQVFDEKAAAELGETIVQKHKEELAKQGKEIEDKPLWQKALKFTGETFAAILAFHLVGKYVLRPALNLKTSIRRSFELSSRLKNIEAKESSALAAGAEPRLMYKSKEGQELPVENVRFQDGKLRVKDGENSKTVKLAKGDSLYLQEPPESKLTKEEIKELAGKKLAPVAEETALNDLRERYESELKKRELEIAELKKAQQEMTLNREAKGAGTQAALPEARPEARPERVVPKAEALQASEVKASGDGIERLDSKVGEQLARKQLMEREKIEAREIETLKKLAKELESSQKAVDKERAKALEKTISALEGKLGPEAQGQAHKEVLKESRLALERGEAGGYGRAVKGGLIGGTILLAAALAYYNSRRSAEVKEQQERARATKR